MIGTFSRPPRPAARALGLLLILGSPALAQDQGVRSEVDARRIGVEDVVQWHVRLEGDAAQAAGEIAVPPLKNLKVVGGPSLSTQISLVNGRMSQSKVYTWVMQPLAAGPAEIGALKLKLPGGEGTAPAIGIEVVAGSLGPRGRLQRGTNPLGADPFADMFEAPRARSAGKLFVEAVPSRQRVRVGEGFLLTYFIYARGVQATDMQSVSTPQYPGFWAENVESTDPPREEAVTVDGEAFARFPIYRKLLFATRAGDLTIPPLTVRVALARQSLFDSGTVVERSTKPVKVQVEALPAAVSAPGAVGRFKVETTVEPRSLQLGDAATVRFRVEGTGNLKWVEKGPDLVVPGAKVFAPQVKSNLQPRIDGFAGSKTWEYVVVPETAGRLTIPALPFTWFDPGEGKVASQGGTPLDLEVRGATSLAGLPAPGPAAVPRGRGNLALRDALDPPARVLPPLPVRALAAILLGAALLHLGLAVSGRVGLGRSAAARGAARAALKHLKRASEPGLAKEEAAALIERALQEAFAGRNGEGATTTSARGWWPGSWRRSSRCVTRRSSATTPRRSRTWRNKRDKRWNDGPRAAPGRAVLPLFAQADPGARFHEANALARAGDYPKAIEGYAQLAQGESSPSLFWNWAQAARARGAAGEALWALLRARDLEPGDRAIAREIEEVRAELGLDVAEIAPEPLSAVARFAHRFALGWLSALLLLLSVLAHAAARFTRAARTSALAWTAAGLAIVAATPALLSGLERPQGVVVRRGAPLLPSASPTATAAGTLREGEVVPILDESGGYVRLEDSSGARGWALAEDVRRLREPSTLPVLAGPGQ